MAEGYTPSDRVNEFADMGALAKGYDEASAKVLSKGILIPGDGASDDDKSAFTATMREHLGTTPPESADGYTWKPPAGMEDQFKGSEALFAKYHEAGYSDKAVSFFMQEKADDLSAVTAAMSEKQVELAKESEAALKEKWGDDHAENMKGANAMKARLPDLVSLLETVGLANHQAVIEGMHELSMGVSEARPPGNTPKEVKGINAEIAELKALPAYMRGNDPKHEETIGRIRELQRQIPV